MKSAVLVFPGINRERDLARAFHEVSGVAPHMVWHTETELPDVDVVAIPGGFSYGDYLRCGAIAARSPIIEAVRRHADRGGYVLGICNGFQIVTEIGLLPGALMRNASLKFVCKEVRLRVENASTALRARAGSPSVTATRPARRPRPPTRTARSTRSPASSTSAATSSA